MMIKITAVTVTENYNIPVKQHYEYSGIDLSQGWNTSTLFIDLSQEWNTSTLFKETDLWGLL